MKEGNYNCSAHSIACSERVPGSDVPRGSSLDGLQRCPKLSSCCCDGLEECIHDGKLIL